MIDLGAPKQVEGVETLIAGYLADFPGGSPSTCRRRRVVVDGLGRRDGAHDLRGRPRNAADGAAAGSRSANRRAQYIRMRQTGADRIYYWTIAELRSSAPDPAYPVPQGSGVAVAAPEGDVYWD